MNLISSDTTTTLVPIKPGPCHPQFLVPHDLIRSCMLPNVFQEVGLCIEYTHTGAFELHGC